MIANFFNTYCVYASICSLSGKMLINSSYCRQRYSHVASANSLWTVKASHASLAPDCWHPHKTKVLPLSLRANPKLLLAVKLTSSVASSDTLLNKHIEWFGCTSRYASHSDIYCSSPCYSLQTQTGWYLSCHQSAYDTNAARILVRSHTDNCTLHICLYFSSYNLKHALKSSTPPRLTLWEATYSSY